MPAASIVDCKALDPVSGAAAATRAAASEHLDVLYWSPGVLGAPRLRIGGSWGVLLRASWCLDGSPLSELTTPQ